MTPLDYVAYAIMIAGTIAAILVMIFVMFVVFDATRDLIAWGDRGFRPIPHTPGDDCKCATCTDTADSGGDAPCGGCGCSH
jgi:hypothetical protein